MASWLNHTVARSATITVEGRELRVESLDGSAWHLTLAPSRASAPRRTYLPFAQPGTRSLPLWYGVGVPFALTRRKLSVPAYHGAKLGQVAPGPPPQAPDEVPARRVSSEDLSPQAARHGSRRACQQLADFRRQSLRVLPPVQMRFGELPGAPAPAGTLVPMIDALLHRGGQRRGITLDLRPVIAVSPVARASDRNEPAIHFRNDE